MLLTRSLLRTSRFSFSRLYTQEHEWLDIHENIVNIGITNYASQQLGEIALVDPKELGSEIEKGESMGALECVKTVAELYSPYKGEIHELN